MTQTTKREPEWLTQSAYARLRGVSAPAVVKMIRTGRVETNGKTGRDCRVRDKRQDASLATLETAKLEKLHVDVELQRQRIAENVETMRREWVELILEELARAYAPLKVRLTDLRLTAEQTGVLRDLLESCETSFVAGVRGRLAE